jgi:hypothetical protein
LVVSYEGKKYTIKSVWVDENGIEVSEILSNFLTKNNINKDSTNLIDISDMLTESNHIIVKPTKDRKAAKAANSIKDNSNVFFDFKVK